MEAPIDLKHKPIIVVNDYKQVEPYPESTDAMALSIGFAQWSTDVRDFQIKIFQLRYLERVKMTKIRLGVAKVKKFHYIEYLIWPFLHY